MIAVVETVGDSDERGYQFGTMRRDEIARWLDGWLSSLERSGISSPVRYIEGMIANTNFSEAIARHTPDLAAEVEAIARGAHVPFKHLFAAQLMDEEWAYRADLTGANESRDKCSSLAMRDDSGATWVAQNMDLDPFTDGHQIILKVNTADGDPTSAVFSVGGLIGLLGVNDRGLAVCVNSLPQLPSAREGLPVAYVVRRLLQTGSVSEAASVLRSFPHATGQHYLIGDPIEIRSFEASAIDVIEYIPTSSGRIFHTNHSLMNDYPWCFSEGALYNTTSRLRSLDQRLSTAEPSLIAIQQALSASDDPQNPVCRTKTAEGSPSTTSFTTGSMISRIDQSNRQIEYWVAAGPPCLRNYEHFVMRAC